MKKLTLILMLLAVGLMAVSCGHSDEPEPVKPDEITRVQYIKRTVPILPYSRYLVGF